MNVLKTFKHDTLVTLKPGSPYESILNLFPERKIPMRDPFPMEVAKGQQISLWIVDLSRLNILQSCNLAQLIASHCNVDPTEVAAEAYAQGGFAMSNEWIDSMWCGPEGTQRTKELIDFLGDSSRQISETELRNFYLDQHNRWIEGTEVPPPMPNRIEDFDPRLHTEELIIAIEIKEIDDILNEYPATDVLIPYKLMIIDLLEEIN